MNSIVVTGGAGRLGRFVIEDLQGRGYSVLAVDRVRPEKLQCRFQQADLTQPAAVYDVMAGADAVIHLGAIPGPSTQPSSVIFQTNVTSTLHVAEAAAALGLKKIVFASSMFTLGWHEAADVYWPKYAPVDEEHPTTPFEGYGLSKVVGEEICAMISRRTGIPSVSLRIMNVIQTDGYDALPWPSPSRDAGVRFVLWPYVDVRDAAVACRQALEAETAGHEAIYIAAEDIRFNAPTETLLRDLAPLVEIRQPLPDRTSVINLNKARHLIGYQPQFSWQTISSSLN